VFAVEGVRRLVDPPEVDGAAVLATALAGIVVNLLAAWALSKANRTSLNVEGSFQHIVTDLYAFIGTAIAAGIILATGWNRADPLATLLVAALMLKAGYSLVRESGRVLLEAAPRGIDPAAVQSAILASSGVIEVHELHVWEVTSGFPALSAHVLVDADCDCHAGRQLLEQMLAARFGIDHTTLQVDHRDDLDLDGRTHVGHPGELGVTGDHDHPFGCR
jgi:cobalt-zinc-cadmium efflux system protein